MDSADGPSDDPVPAPPEGLLDELEKRLSPNLTTAPAAKPSSWLDRVARFVTSPGFAIATAAAVVTFLAVPYFRSEKAETFRDPAATVSDGPKVVLLQAPESTWSDLSSGGLLDPDALIRANLPDEASDVAPPKIVVDFTAGELRSVAGDGTIVASEPINPDELPSAIARMLSALDGR